MRPSSEYVVLKRRLEHLQVHLPNVPSTQTTFSDMEMDGLAAYAVLACAACEEFLEQRCLQVAQLAKNKFATTGKLTRAAVSLLALKFSKKDNVSKRDTVFNQHFFKISISTNDIAANRPVIAGELEACLRLFQAEYIKSNHGIDSKYMSSLLSPIGFLLSDVDPGLRSKVDRLARMRGDAAHRRAIQSRMLVHPSILISEAPLLASGFEDLDKKLSEHARKRR